MHVCEHTVKLTLTCVHAHAPNGSLNKFNPIVEFGGAFFTVYNFSIRCHFLNDTKRSQ